MLPWLELLRLSDALSGSRLWVTTDYNGKGQVNWRREAREDFDLRPVNGSRRKIRRSCGTQLAVSTEFSGVSSEGIADVGKGSWYSGF